MQAACGLTRVNAILNSRIHRLIAAGHAHDRVDTQGWHSARSTNCSMQADDARLWRRCDAANTNSRCHGFSISDARITTVDGHTANDSAAEMSCQNGDAALRTDSRRQNATIAMGSIEIHMHASAIATSLGGAIIWDPGSSGVVHVSEVTLPAADQNTVKPPSVTGRRPAAHSVAHSAAGVVVIHVRASESARLLLGHCMQFKSESAYS